MRNKTRHSVSNSGIGACTIKRSKTHFLFQYFSNVLRSLCFRQYDVTNLEQYQMKRMRFGRTDIFTQGTRPGNEVNI